MAYIILSSLVLFVGGIISWITRNRRAQMLLGAGSAIAGSIIPLATISKVLLKNTPIGISFKWGLPGGVISLYADSLSALFLLPLLVISCTAAVYAIGYLKSEQNSGKIWFFYNSLVSSMVLVVVAANGIFFLLAWELMSLVSLLLVLHEHHKSSNVAKAGWIYFVATHAGSAFLIPLFLGLSSASGSFEFASLGIHSIHGTIATVLFICAVIGFGCKAGFVPFHVWLPEAHPAAPSHISALMSGVMIKMGIYGLLRIYTFLQPAPYSWGIILICIGVLSGLIGIIFAIAQRDIKRLLAYSSIENIGIITLGLGIGMIGIAKGNGFVAVAGFSGALLHIINHAFLKSLLFMGIGAVVHGTGFRDMEKLGGLIKKLPSVAVAVLIGSAAICGLPPLNGFISEFLIFISGIYGIKSNLHMVMIISICTIVSLAAIGGLAVGAFSKLFGIVFLGEPRNADIKIHKPCLTMIVPLFVHIAICIMLAFGVTYILPLMIEPLHLITSIRHTDIINMIYLINQPLRGITTVTSIVIGILLLVLLWRLILLSRHKTTVSGTWDCGYASPTSRMQYTGTSFVQPLTDFFSTLLKSRKSISVQDDLFPKSGQFQNEVNDTLLTYIFEPFFRGTVRAFSKLRWLQGGKMHIYVLYIVIAVIFALTAAFIL
ncbi:MAG: proton-conducting transporter membrane subunit [Fibrobacter sp.]|nr:proton-conducting transporter membrane subunit [Fibrobacter sp.]